MLIRRMINDSILEVEEILISPYVTQTRYFYTDIKTWESLTNPAATKQEGSFPYRVPMAQSAIDWCKQYDLPNVIV